MLCYEETDAAQQIRSILIRRNNPILGDIYEQISPFYLGLITQRLKCPQSRGNKAAGLHAT